MVWSDKEESSAKIKFDDWQSTDLGSNPSAVESVSFSTERFIERPGLEYIINTLFFCISNFFMENNLLFQISPSIIILLFSKAKLSIFTWGSIFVNELSLYNPLSLLLYLCQNFVFYYFKKIQNWKKEVKNSLFSNIRRFVIYVSFEVGTIMTSLLIKNIFFFLLQMTRRVGIVSTRTHPFFTSHFTSL